MPYAEVAIRETTTQEVAVCQESMNLISVTHIHLNTEQHPLSEAFDEQPLPKDYTYDSSDELYHIQTLSQTNLKDDTYCNLTLTPVHAVMFCPITASVAIDRAKATAFTAHGGTQVTTLGIVTLPCSGGPSPDIHSLPFHVVDTHSPLLHSVRTCTS